MTTQLHDVTALTDCALEMLPAREWRKQPGIDACIECQRPICRFDNNNWLFDM